MDVNTRNSPTENIVPFGKLRIIDLVDLDTDMKNFDRHSKINSKGHLPGLKLTDGITTVWESDTPNLDYGPEIFNINDLIDGGIFNVQISHVTNLCGFEGVYKEVVSDLSIAVLGELNSEEQILKAIEEKIKRISQREKTQFRFEKIKSRPNK